MRYIIEKKHRKDDIQNQEKDIQQRRNRLTYKKCTEDMSHTFDFINIKPVIKSEIPFFEKIKPLKPWEMLRTNANPV